jgi:integrase
LVFTTRLGKPLDYSRWRSRIWAPVLQVPTQFGGHNGMKVLHREPLLDGQAPTPHDMRHTYGTRLAEQGVPQHEIMALMGHKDVRAVQRYTHAGEARFERARVALGRARDGSRLTTGS